MKNKLPGSAVKWLSLYSTQRAIQIESESDGEWHVTFLERGTTPALEKKGYGRGQTLKDACLDALVDSHNTCGKDCFVEDLTIVQTIQRKEGQKCIITKIGNRQTTKSKTQK